MTLLIPNGTGIDMNTNIEAAFTVMLLQNLRMTKDCVS